jgi:hypothetical protein
MPQFMENPRPSRRRSRLNTPGHGQGARWSAKALGQPLPPTSDAQPVRYRTPIEVEGYATHAVLYAPPPSVTAIYLRSSRPQPGPATVYRWCLIGPDEQTRGNWDPRFMGPKFASLIQAVRWGLDNDWIDLLPQVDPDYVEDVL